MMESPKFPPKDLESLCFHSLCDELIWISLWHSRLDGVLIMGFLVFSSLARTMTFACWHQLSLLFLVYFLKNWNRNPDATEIGALNANLSVFLSAGNAPELCSCIQAMRCNVHGRLFSVKQGPISHREKFVVDQPSGYRGNLC
jgi:hypothetical protein